jgi:TetR/AcrR family transcriptional regulator, regulator of cefoperazone and chloramphenicol sensitivity
MRSADRTAAAVIRDAAMRLFADRGVGAVSIRDIAGAARVSASLVIHHYKSKDGLQAAVDARVTEWVSELLEEFTRSPAARSSASIGAALSEAVGADPALVGYLRRLLVDGGATAAPLFRALLEVTATGLADMEAVGIARPTADPAVRAAFLLVNDLALIVLRDQVTAVLGVDPLGRDGMARWSAVVLEVYTRGVFDVAQEGADS